jgi:hypothetical protein
MGQFTLGIRSLLIKATIFVIMAALLAWALGGTLWPRQHVAYVKSSSVGDPKVSGRSYFWRISLDQRVQERATWTLMFNIRDLEYVPAEDRSGREGAGPVVAGDSVYFGGRTLDGQWAIAQLDGTTSRVAKDTSMPDRLAVEQQLERIRVGLPLQDAETISRQRTTVLDPQPEVADKE